ncbi:MAG: Thioredoxin-related protein [Candidatus Accumulibacter appositus]|uniref:Thioredoxin-related protein n=1 Tax=Candidatus Accumulibacter appositus TaxID=1454003 RepID=A0A011NTW9_9PROT|nr:thioredoxin domain-containing protein [Accumulibacter sp.]EXI78806.1 MAG: Thioredoxin-related protein [Candidatus Accumulibacter appositus]HRF05816.1 thioredoxin domain-containing protein [Accumulibacter sp.]
MTDGTAPGSAPFSAELANTLSEAIARRGPGHVARTHHLDEQGRPRFTNRLALETSPYLLQHAHNPVNWFPWGEEAFAEARRLGRPVFLSIGYSTCHWCHVMEAESFEDEEIARFLNQHYVAVKVDREERPDVDAVYMSAVQQLTGSGGWPMSVWLTAAREPFFAGTYFPPRDGLRAGSRGFLSLLGALSETFHRDPDRVGKAAAALVEAVRQDMQGTAAANTPSATKELPARQLIDATIAHYKASFDGEHGGLQRAPKFPSHVPVRLLLRYVRRTGDREALHMATLTLEKMAAGGLYDQLGGGFHRYSTDAQWLLPHFEKMLYDNALLVVAYAEAFQLSGRADFARVARETCDYVLREMTDSDGAFYSATDADSEGEEGRFFVWTEDEIRHELAPLGSKTTRLFLEHYDVRPGGNWEGSNILNVPQADEARWAALGEARALLYEARARRLPPLRDDKILAAWNGLMISALAVAGRILDEPRYLAAAKRAADFVLTRLRSTDDELQRSYKDAQARQAAFLDDHAFLAAGLIDLYEASFEARWLAEALTLAQATERLFADPTGGWFMSSARHETLIAREKPAYDGAEPSGTSVALMNALRLGVFTGDDHWRKIAERGLHAHAQVLRERPIAMTEALLALDFLADTPLEIAIVWPDGVADAADAAAPLLTVLRRTYLPSRAIAGGPESAIEALAETVAFVRGKVAQDGRPTAYVCRQGRCELPVTDAAALSAQLGRAAR